MKATVDISKIKMHYKLEIDIKSSCEEIQGILEKINKIIFEEFQQINNGETDIEVMPTFTMLDYDKKDLDIKFIEEVENNG